MAHGLAAHLAEERGIPVEVRSASTLGLSGDPADPKAVKVCGELGIDLHGHEATPLTDALLDWADKVFVMERRHLDHLWDHHPDHAADAVMLGFLAGIGDVADPLGGWTFTFRRTRDRIRTAIETLVDRLDPEGVETA